MPRPTDIIAAIKQAVDMVALATDYHLPQLHRAGSKFKALCPFHDDRNPSLQLDPERQSFKCWACGAGGDVFDFVMRYERVEFPEAKRMLAERAGIALDEPADRAAAAGPSKPDLLAACAWAEGEFAAALAGSGSARDYALGRGLTEASLARFGLGLAPDGRDWLLRRGRAAGFGLPVLEAAGLATRSAESGIARDRFRGRLIFPIRDGRGRPIAFGGRILPEAEEKLAAAGLKVAKYLNSPETALFQKRRQLYAADLAREAARQAGWVAVVEGYTDVIAAHQVGLENVVGTLGTALGDDHIQALRRLADRVVLVFDGDEAGQKAADRSLELFLAHEVDVRVLTLPDGLDPCDYLLKEGAGPFRAMLDRAVDPLEFAVGRAAGRFDLDSPEGARQAARWVLEILAKIPTTNRAGLDLKVAKALDTLARRLGLPVADLKRQLRATRRPAKSAAGEPAAGPAVSESAGAPIRAADLDPTDRELIDLVLADPTIVARLVRRVPVNLLRDAPTRTILAACYDALAEGLAPNFEAIAPRLAPEVRALAAGFAPSGADSGRLPATVQPGGSEDRLAGVLASLAERDRQERLRDIEAALREVDPAAEPEQHQALRREKFRLLSSSSASRPDPRKKSAS